MKYVTVVPPTGAVRHCTLHTADCSPGVPNERMYFGLGVRSAAEYEEERAAFEERQQKAKQIDASMPEDVEVVPPPQIVPLRSKRIGPVRISSTMSPQERHEAIHLLMDMENYRKHADSSREQSDQ